MFGNKKEEPTLQEEAQKLQMKARKLYQEKVQRVSKQIMEILEKENLTLKIIHNIELVQKNG
jgi:3-oxoacyl-[acyl-carrier-protein] synthase III